ncbi:MAG: flagellar basal body rod protein FlgB [Clostridiales bacterium]|nr:flagellar basal body rod protein FlgB [Clostridiales bacterium]
MDWLNDNSMLLAQKTLDVSWAKQKAALNNIANVDTPGFKAKYVLFEDELRSRLSRFSGLAAVRKSDVREAILGSRMRIRQSDEESIRADGNNVNLDVEELEIARNTYQYEFALRQVNDQLSRLRIAIEGR